MSRILMLSFVAGLICGGVLLADGGVTSKTPAKNQAKNAEEPGKPLPKLKKELFTGKVVPLRAALKKRGVTSFAEFDKQVVLETPDGGLIPLVSDWRGRAFFQDERLRERKVELVGYRRKGLPYLQVLMVFTFDKNGVRQYTDYWCDICSIPMYEIKPCDCCQADIRLRFQPQALPSYLLGNGKTD